MWCCWRREKEEIIMKQIQWETNQFQCTFSYVIRCPSSGQVDLFTWSNSSMEFRLRKYPQNSFEFQRYCCWANQYSFRARAVCVCVNIVCDFNYKCEDAITQNSKTRKAEATKRKDIFEQIDSRERGESKHFLFEHVFLSRLCCCCCLLRLFVFVERHHTRLMVMCVCVWMCLLQAIDGSQ